MTGQLVELARARQDCSTAQLAHLSGLGDRAVRHALAEPETRAEQLLRLHAQSATPAERAALVQDFAEAIGAEVVVLSAAAAGAVVELATHLRRAA